MLRPEQREQGKVWRKEFILTPERSIALLSINVVVMFLRKKKYFEVYSLNFHIFITVQQQIYIFPGICRYKSGKTPQALLDSRL